MSNERTSSLPRASAAGDGADRAGPTWPASHRASRLRGRGARGFAGHACRTLPPRRFGLPFSTAAPPLGAALRMCAAGAARSEAACAATGDTAADNSVMMQMVRANIAGPFEDSRPGHYSGTAAHSGTLARVHPGMIDSVTGTTVSGTWSGTAGDDRRWRIALAAALLYILAFAAVPAERIGIGTVMTVAGDLAAVVMILAGVRRYKPRRSKAWLLI